MKKKKIALKKSPLECAHFGPVEDMDGNLPCEDNLGRLLSYLIESKIPKRQKIRFCVSRVGDDTEDYSNPFRYEEVRIRTAGYLLRLWKSFDVEEFKSTIDFRQACLEKEGQRRAAWGQYASYVRMQQVIKEEDDFNNSIKHLPTSKQSEAIVKRKQNAASSGGMFVG